LETVGLRLATTTLASLRGVVYLIVVAALEISIVAWYLVTERNMAHRAANKTEATSTSEA